MNLDQANKILNKYITSDRLLNHCYIVSKVMKHFANKLNEDEEKWEIVGLLHDIDYEKYPEEHCIKSVDILKEEGLDDSTIYSIQSHGYGLTKTDAKPNHIMEKVLFTIDELTGLIYSTALMRPDKKINQVEVKSVMKKFKTPSFSAKVDRQVILKGCEMLNMTIEEVVQECLIAMKQISDEIGL